MLTRSLTFALVLLVLGCGDESDPAPVSPPSEACEPPSRVVGEQCLEPGVQDDGCPAGTLGLEDGTCQPAGVPPELCAEGFVHDGDAACEPILPLERCPKGLMAVPGDAACRPVMDCGSGRWGDIPVDGSTIYVDAAYSGGTSDGTEQQPFTNISAAVTAAPDGALIAIAAGSYVGDHTISKPVRLWGVCPEQVEIEGTGTFGAIVFRPGASGSEVHALAVTGADIGIVAWGVEDITLDRLWVHDAASNGVNAQDDQGAVDITVTQSLIEANHGTGVYVYGVRATLRASVVRGTLPLSNQGGRGINVQPGQIGGGASATITGVVVEDNRENGVYVSGSEVTLEGVVVRGTQPGVDGKGGRGLTIRADSQTLAPAVVAVRSSLVESNHTGGVFIQASLGTLEGVVVRGTLSNPGSQSDGSGVVIISDLDTHAPATGLLRSSLVADNRNVGVLISGSQATLEGVVVRDTFQQESDAGLGVGVFVQGGSGGMVPGSAVASGSLVENNREAGVFVKAAQLTLDGVTVRETAARVSDGVFGDGVLVGSAYGTSGLVEAGAVVSHARIEGSARAGLSNFGGQVSIGASALSCNLVQLAREPFLESQANFEDLGANGCGCPEPSGECVAETSGLAPPELDPM